MDGQMDGWIGGWITLIVKRGDKKKQVRDFLGLSGTDDIFLHHNYVLQTNRSQEVDFRAREIMLATMRRAKARKPSKYVTLQISTPKKADFVNEKCETSAVLGSLVSSVIVCFFLFSRVIFLDETNAYHFTIKIICPLLWKTTDQRTIPVLEV